MDSSSENAGSYTPPKLENGISAPLSEPREWFFLIENRLLIASGLLVVAFVVFVAVEVATSLTEEGLQPLFAVFGALIGGNFTLVTIVISISQLVISQQLGAPGDLREQIAETNQYREAVEEEIDREVAPVTPTDFLELLLERTEDTLDALDDELDDISETDGRDDLDELVSHLRTHIERVHALLSRSEVGLFEALSVTLQTNYANEIYQARSLTTEYADLYPDEVRTALDEVVVRLQQIDVARQYLKTLYMQDELARMSRLLLYTGVPAVLVSMVMMHQFAAATHAVLAPTTLSALVPVALTVGVAPLAVLFAYVLRVSKVAQRTAAITPFTTPMQERTIVPDSTPSARFAQDERTGSDESE
ncbi:hypothetical protein ACFQH6_12340 [Halobacteriaceae archaeon GCM10025711]